MAKGKLLLYYRELKETGLQELQESMSRALGLAAMVTYPDGRPLTKISNLCAFCTLLNTSPEGRARCVRDRVLSARAAVKAGHEVLHPCHAGLVHLAVPLRVAGEIVAVALGGNVALRPLSQDAVARLARETGLDPEELQVAARAVPLWPEERLRAAMGLVRAVTDTVAGLVYARQELRRKVDELTALYEFGWTVAASLDTALVARQALEAVLGLTGATSGSVVLLDESAPLGRETVSTVESCQEFRVVPAGEVVAAVEREARAAHFNSRPEGLTPEERRPAVAVPLMVGGRVTGVLTIAGRPGGASFTEDEAAFLTTLGASLGLALENTRLFRQLEARAAMLERLVEVGQVVSGSLDVDVVIASALASVRDVLGGEWCALRLLDEDTGELVLKANLGMSPELQARAARIRPEGTLLEEVLRTGKPVVVEELGPDGASMPYYAAEMRAVAVVPVKAGGKILGTLKVYSPVPRRWSEEEVGYLATIASQTGLALENARLYSLLREHYRRVVRALAAALEAKDPYTRGHSARVADMARACARTMGLGSEEQEQVHLAGLLHDVGKIGVPEDVLLKPGPLDAAEKKEMEGHPEVGARIVEPAGFPAAVVAAVRHHHEDYDGGGYPAGLAGEEIPLLARIIRVADAYDAMTSARPYRGPLSPDQAREELRRFSGRQFDPRVVEAFLGMQEHEIGGAEKVRWWG